MRIQANGFLWQQALDGTLVTTPTDKLLVFPVILTLQPGEIRLLRVGTTIKSDQNERSYRVIISAFPLDASQETSGASLSMRARVSIPIFVAPIKLQTDADVVDPVAHKNRLTFGVRNGGTAHFSVKAAHVTVTGAGGEILSSGSVAGWYVLAGDQRPFSYPLAAGVCAKAAAVTISLDGPPVPVKKTFDRVSKQCGAA
jgi:P pilus assembly chaperone PapD